jgi:hypothetical protein
MKTPIQPLIQLALGWTLVLGAAHAAEPVRVLVVWGGHDFETNQFLQVFRANPAITFQTVQHPQAHAWFKADRAAQYDVLVFYDMWQEISPDARADFVSRLQEGKGLVALHHTLASYQQWPEYADIIGGKYHLENRVENGRTVPGSTYQHDVRFRVRVLDANHPVTRGVKDFEIQDETYGQFEVKAGVHPLLGTEERTSGPTIAWAKNYGQARVVYLELGHDHLAYENPNYRRLLAQAIRWTARRD